MTKMAGFFIGALAGAIVGVAAMCCVSVVNE